MGDSSSSKGKWLVVAFVWIAIIAVGAVAWKYFVAPRREKAAEQAKVEEKQQVIENTSSDTRYKHELNFAHDSFSGYAIARSDEFRNELASRSIRLNLVLDEADYVKRLKDLRDGKLQMGVFTMDALIKACSEIGDTPATISSITDETYGADAIVANSKAFPNIDALNDPETKFVITANSPSETLARVVMSHFNLDRLSADPFIRVNGAKEVFAAYQNSKTTDKKVFVLWEPYVSKILKNPEYTVIIDSSKFRGYLVDVIIVSRDFLLKHEDLVDGVLRSYFKANYAYRDRMPELILADAKAMGEPLTSEMAKKLTEKILWKNTQENFAHFGLSNGHNYQHVEDMLANITKVLLKTGAIKTDPVNGRYNELYYDKTMRSLFDNNFHPGVGAEEMRKEVALAKLTDEEWKKLIPVGTLQVPRLVFGRGNSILTTQSEETLMTLAHDLKTWPQYYLIVRGHCSKVGNIEANKQLAAQRAEATVEWLVKNGVDKNRLKSDISEPNGSTTVAFILGQSSY